jgi:hypothetical protein
MECRKTYIPISKSYSTFSGLNFFWQLFQQIPNQHQIIRFLIPVFLHWVFDLSHKVVKIVVPQYIYEYGPYAKVYRR